MRAETMVVGSVLVAVAVTALLVLWFKSEDPVQEGIVQGLAEPHRASTPPASPPVVMPAAVEPPKVASRSVSLLFEFDSAALRTAEAAKLEALLGTGLKRVDAVGHADRVGPAAYNMKLSERRATSVKDYLVDRKVDADMVRTSAKGELEPVTGDACLEMGPERRGNAGLVECLQLDRRVEVSVSVN